MTTENRLPIEDTRAQFINPPSVVERPTEDLQVEEPHNEQSALVWLTGPKLYINVTCLFVAEFLLGLSPSVYPVLRISSKQSLTLAGTRQHFPSLVCCFNFFFAKLYTLFAIKKLLIISLVIFEAGSLLCTVAPTSAAFICGRAIAGMGNSGITAGCVLVIVHSFPNHKRPLVNGLVGGVFTLAMFSAPLLGGVLIDAWNWRLFFLINLPLGVIVIASTWYNFRDPAPSPEFSLPLKAKAKRIDPWGTLLMFAGIPTFLIALQWGGLRFPWHSPVIISLFVMSLVLFVGFGYLQHRLQEKTVLPPRYLKNRTIVAAAWFSLCVSGSLTVVEQYLSMFFQSVKSYSASKAGIMSVPLIIGLAIGAPIGGAVISKVGYYSIPMYVTAILSPIAAGFLSTVDLDQSNVQVLTFLGVLGFAAGFGSSSAVCAIQTILKPTEVPSGLAVTSVGGTMGAAISICVSGTIFQIRLIDEVREQDSSIDIAYLTHVGLTKIRQSITLDQLGKVLRGYDEAIDQTLYLPVALTVLLLIGPLVVEWRSVKENSA